MLMGFYLPQNFNSPYKAENAQQFWRRWHMTLSRWLRDYLYIPLGGNPSAATGTPLGARTSSFSPSRSSARSCPVRGGWLSRWRS